MISRLKMLLIGLGAIAGYMAYQAYQVSELASGLVVLFVISWFMFSIIGWGSLWNLISIFKNPVMAGLMIAGLGFTYWTYGGNPFGESSIFGTGIFFLGAALGMWLTMYWTIGE